MLGIRTLDEYLAAGRKGNYDRILVVENALWDPRNELVAKVDQIKSGEVIDVSETDLKHWRPIEMAEGPLPPNELLVR